nr:hypothetical protein Iba_chr06cCG12640 [Ipomoea batatas]
MAKQFSFSGLLGNHPKRNPGVSKKFAYFMYIKDESRIGFRLEFLKAIRCSSQFSIDGILHQLLLRPLSDRSPGDMAQG